MGYMIDIDLIILFEVGADVFPDFSDRVVKRFLINFGNDFQREMIQILLNFHQLYPIFLELVLKSPLL